MSAVAVVTKAADQSTDDRRLVAAVRAGDDRAFELLFARYHGRIESYVRGMVRDHGRAEDVTQEVFIAALRRMRETEREINFKPWIYEIAKNACIDAFRRSRNTHEISFDAEDGLAPADHGRLAASGSGPDALVDTKLAIDDLCGAFGGLSQTHHDILVMREFDGLSYREIGERMGMSRAGVESTLFRARRRLGEEYEEIANGERCLRVRSIVDARAARVVGLRDQRRMARHVSHCQPCRRYARMAGVEFDGLRAPAAARIAALLPPLPAFFKRRGGIDDAGSVLGGHPSSAAHLAAVLDPTVVSGWSKAIATAASVAVAGLGAGAAVGEPQGFAEFFNRAPAIVGMASERPADAAGGASPARAGARPGSATAASPGAAATAPGGTSDPGAAGKNTVSSVSDAKSGTPGASGSLPTGAPGAAALGGAGDGLDGPAGVTPPAIGGAGDAPGAGAGASGSLFDGLDRRNGVDAGPGSGSASGSGSAAAGGASGAGARHSGLLNGISGALGGGAGGTGAAGAAGNGATGAGSGVGDGAAGAGGGAGTNGDPTGGAVGSGGPSGVQAGTSAPNAGPLSRLAGALSSAGSR
jgi:RNA polymerase sigma factor (sigma-70 family)